MDQEIAKEAAGKRAASLVETGTIIGLGSGSTALAFISALIYRVEKEGLQVQTVASSRASLRAAEKGGLKVLDINAVSHIDLTVDGADEIDPQKRMIKGGGGAHVREKILASSSKEMIVIVDPSKQVPRLGRAKLPVEVIFFGSPATRHKIEERGFQGKWRMQQDGTLFVTENGNLLFDIHFPTPPASPEEVHETLIQIPGVVDTGFFFGLAGRVIVGHPDGTTEILA